MIFGIAAVLILLMIFSGVAVPLAFLGGSFFVAYMGLGSTGTFATNAFYILNSISMLAIPLFIVGGSLIERSGIANVLIRVADKMLHNVKGGLTATIPVVSCFFGALCGSALATANTLSTAMVPELEKKGYDKAYLAALIAASSPFGFMIPPNVNAIIFASVSSASVGALFMATIVPGLIWAGLYLIINRIIYIKYYHPEYAGKTVASVSACTEDNEPKEESEKNAKQKKAEKSENDSTGSAKQDSTVKTKMTEQRQVSGTEAKAIAEAEAIEASIQPGQYPVMGISSIRAWQLVNYFKAYGSTYPAEVLTQGGAPDIETFAQMYYEEATAEGVRPEVAFAQAMKETGWLQYGGDMQITQYNFAGIGTTGGGVPGNSYPDVRTGIRAQIQHLKAYATDEALVKECVDDRYSYVTKGSAPYVEWLGQKENPEGYGWATGERYGYDIVEMIHAMRK